MSNSFDEFMEEQMKDPEFKKEFDKCQLRKLFSKVKERRLYMFFLDEETGDIVDVSRVDINPERATAKWLIVRRGNIKSKYGSDQAKCSRCGARYSWYMATRDYYYCPCCGAKMETDDNGCST